MHSLVFLHGFLGSPTEAEYWRTHFPDWDVLVPALGIAGDWNAELDRLDHQLPPTAVLTGYSLGARLGIGLAVRNPRRWNSMIVISGSPGLSSVSQRTERIKSDVAWYERLQSDPMEDFLRLWYKQSMFAHEPPHDIAQWIAEKRTVERQRALNCLRALSIAQQPDYRPELPNLRMPVLLLAGERDEKYMVLGREMADALPTAEFHGIAGAGHVLHRTHPAETIRTIQGFLERFRDGSNTPTVTTSNRR